MKISAWNAWTYGGTIVIIASGSLDVLIICSKWFDLSSISGFLSVL